MSEILEISRDFGFYLADLFSRFTVMQESNISLKQCKNLQEIILELSKSFNLTNNLSNNLNTCKNISELKRKLQTNLRDELMDLKCNFYVNYFVDYYKIQLIFSLLEDKKKKIKKIKKISNEIGYFEELKCMEFCKNFQEVRSLILKYSGIEKYFEIDVKSDFNENDFEKVYLKVMKNYYENYSKLVENGNMKGYFEEILTEEISFFIMEMVLNYKKENLGDKIKEFIPLSSKIKVDFTKDSRMNVSEEISERQKKVYGRAFGIFGDLSVIYCYFKLREIQINEIIYEVDLILNC